MHQVWQSKDLKVTGTEDKVREYERKQEDPLSGMRFPYSTDGLGFILDAGGQELGLSTIDSRNARQRAALVAFANTGALLGPLREHYEAWFGSRLGPKTTELFAMHDKALDLARKVNG